MYGLSAPGVVLTMLGINMTKGMDDVVALNVSTNLPSVISTDLMDSTMVCGVMFSSSQSTKKTGFIVNLSNKSEAVGGDDGGILTRFQHVRQISVADPTVGIDHPEVQITNVNGNVHSGKLVLSPYSVTSLF